MSDILIIQTDDGVDAVLNENDLVLTNGLETALLLSLTADVKAEWWGNDLLSIEEQFDGKTLNILKTTALNSAGRLLIEQAVKSDVSKVLGSVKFGVLVVLLVDRVEININIEDLVFVFSYKGGKIENK